MTQFQTKTAQKPYILGGRHIHISLIEENTAPHPSRALFLHFLYPSRMLA